MTARGRPRSSFINEDLGGESQLWTAIVDKIRRCHAVHQKYETISRILESIEGQMESSDSPRESLAKQEEFDKLYREGLKLAEEELRILEEEPDDLLRNLDTLISVRGALEAETPRATQPKPRNMKRTKPETDGALDSPTPAPEVSTPVAAAAPRPPTKQNSRSGSVASGATVKIEVGMEGSETLKAVALMERPKLFGIGTEVFYRHKGKDREGEGIQCRITSVIGEGPKRRYEVQDIDPDANDAEAKFDRASVQSLIAIPGPGTQLPDLPKGKQVLALYPATTTFYKAEVVSMKKEMCRLRFEGEEEKNKEQDVDRRYVLDVKGA